MLDVMFSDDTNTWDLYSDGRYILRSHADPENPKSSQEFFTTEAQTRASLIAENNDNSLYDIDTSLLYRIKQVFINLFSRKT